MAVLFIFAPSIPVKQNPILWILFLALAFFLFFASFLSIKDKDIRYLVFVGLGFRILTMGREPLYSDDWFRFVFDGNLVANGISPYSDSPSGFWSKFGDSLPNPSFPEDKISFVLKSMNSSDFYSVYPPVLQVLFAIPAFFFSFKSDLIWFVWAFQSFYLIVEFFNLKMLSKGNKIVFWLYAGNPLVVLESVSQCHPETLLVFTLLKLQFLLLSQQIPNFVNFSVWSSFGLFIKQSYLFVLPAIYFLTDQKRKSFLLLSSLVALVLLAFLQYGQFEKHMLSGIGLFFHSFRFHGLFETIVYAFLKTFSDRFLYLSGAFSLVLGFVLFMVWWVKFGSRIQSRKKKVRQSLFFALACLLAFSPVVHPWYILPLLALAVPDRKIILILLFYSLSSMCSYIFYSFSEERLFYSFAFLEILGGIALAFSRIDRICKATYSR